MKDLTNDIAEIELTYRSYQTFWGVPDKDVHLHIMKNLRTKEVQYEVTVGGKPADVKMPKTVNASINKKNMKALVVDGAWSEVIQLDGDSFDYMFRLNDNRRSDFGVGDSCEDNNILVKRLLRWCRDLSADFVLTFFKRLAEQRKEANSTEVKDGAIYRIYGCSMLPIRRVLENINNHINLKGPKGWMMCTVGLGEDDLRDDDGNPIIEEIGLLDRSTTDMVRIYKYPDVGKVDMIIRVPAGASDLCSELAEAFITELKIQRPTVRIEKTKIS